MKQTNAAAILVSGFPAKASILLGGFTAVVYTTLVSFVIANTSCNRILVLQNFGILPNAINKVNKLAFLQGQTAETIYRVYLIHKPTCSLYYMHSIHIYVLEEGILTYIWLVGV